VSRAKYRSQLPRDPLIAPPEEDIPNRRTDDAHHARSDNDVKTVPR
jgi:hypothetical protein